MSHEWMETQPELPRPRWQRFTRRLVSEVIQDHVFVIAASVAYFGFIALFPSLIALVSLVGLFADPVILERQVAQFADVMPRGAAELVIGQFSEIVAQNDSTLGLGLLLSLLGSLWGASSGASGLIKALNIAYEQPEERSFLRARGVALLLALGSLVGFTVMAFVLFGLPYVARSLGLLELQWVSTYVRWVSWIVVAVVIAFALAMIYRFAPCRPLPKWRWITWGSATATLLWLAASGLFSFYVSYAGRFQETYGALGAVIVLLLWLYLSALSVLIGAEVDSTVAWMDRGYREPEGKYRQAFEPVSTSA